MAPRFSKGDRVCVKALGNKIGIIDGEPQLLRSAWMYPVSLNPEEESPFYPEDALEAYTPPKTVEQLLVGQEFCPAEEFKRMLIYKKLERPLSDNLYTFYASRTQFLVHQFKPLVKLLGSDTQRLLLADEVGLGKTIEAGIVLTELEARLGSLSRVLVVCPSMLTQKWQTELHKRFGQQFQILNAGEFEAFLDRSVQYGEAERIRAVCSLQALRREQILNKLRELEPRFDIVIVDEAHHMRNPETLSSELGDILSSHSDTVLFLSATPLQLGTPDLFNLMHLLVPEEFPNLELFHQRIEPNECINNALRRLHDPPAAMGELERLRTTAHWDRFERNPRYAEVVRILNGSAKLGREQAIYVQRLLTELNTLSHVFTRTKKRHVEAEFPVREARIIPVNFTGTEMAFYNAVTQYVAEEFTARAGSGQGISFAVIMPQRQVASCIQAAKEKFREIAEGRVAVVSSPKADEGDVIDSDDEEGADWHLDSRQLQAARQLLQLGRQIGDTDTKFDQFLRALRQIQEEDPEAKIMVFSFFKRTLEYLRRRLHGTSFGTEVALIHGDIPMKERLHVIKRFRQSQGFKILLSSEVGGEGLDFEFCNVIFNYDLPWNPMRVEQRIGRLDRFGQQHEKILIFNFSMKGTIDDEILQRLYRRINIFERYIGDLEAILGDEITQLVRDIFNTKLTDEQKVRRIEQVALTLERKRQDLDEFEQQSGKFVGQDEYFTQEVSRILQSRRFITADEVRHFLVGFLAEKYPRTTLNPPKSKREGMFVLKADEEFRRFVLQHLPGDDRRQEVERKLSFESGTLVTFGSEAACMDESLEFLTIHHPIVRAIKHYYDEHKNEIRSVAHLRLRHGLAAPGRYFLFLYLLEKVAMKTELQLVPLLVSLNGSQVYVQDEVTEWLMGEIIYAEDSRGEPPGYEGTQSAGAITAARELVQMVRQDEEARLQRTNNQLVDNRVESCRDASAIKIRKAQQTIRKLAVSGHKETDPIVRLYRGRIRRLEVEREEKVRSLDARREVSVSLSLVAGGVLGVG